MCLTEKRAEPFATSSVVTSCTDAFFMCFVFVQLYFSFAPLTSGT